MNLREDKHWSYGAYTGLVSARGQRTFYVITSVQTDKTCESVLEVMGELSRYVGNQPATAEELNKVILNNTLSLTGSWETAGSVLGSISQIVQYGLPDDYFRHYAQAVATLELPEVQRIANKLIDPTAMVWVVVGDRAQIETGLNALGYGDVILIDADGNKL